MVHFLAHELAGLTRWRLALPLRLFRPFGMTGDSDEIRELTKARAMVIREYLIKHFKMDDTHLKKMGLGKSEQSPNDAGHVEIIVYQPGTQLN